MKLSLYERTGSGCGINNAEGLILAGKSCLKISRLVFISDIAGPDMNYLIEFFRVQFTVSLLVGLVFIPKEEIRKLYSQLEQIKTVNMVYENRHLSKSTSHLHDSSVTEIGNSFANPSASPRRSRRNQRLSPAAELSSDFV
ncbi:hypothetical protein QZH41_013109 [Actinostola sp. cb2023]|nr:hypothetical protein QZH41_013109 [Actinostola sp. cb2023]